MSPSEVDIVATVGLTGDVIIESVAPTSPEVAITVDAQNVGPPGSPGARGLPGIPGLKWRGPYDPLVTYSRGDAVEGSDGASYISTQDNNLNHVPQDGDVVIPGVGPTVPPLNQSDRVPNVAWTQHEWGFLAIGSDAVEPGTGLAYSYIAWTVWTSTTPVTEPYPVTGPGLFRVRLWKIPDADWTSFIQGGNLNPADALLVGTIDLYDWSFGTSGDPTDPSNGFWPTEVWDLLADFGDQGPQGIQGPAGANGAAGAAGPQGIQGPAGADGAAGAAGPQGPKGDTGDTGPAGAAGAAGPAGPAGPAGAQGIKGDTGDVGPAGPAGAAGAQGAQGPAGAQGPQGPVGPQGPQGPAGSGGVRTDSPTAISGLVQGVETAETVNMPGKGSLVYSVTVDQPCRLRLYATTAQATADLSRGVGTNPSGNHGLLLEIIFSAAGTWNLSPTVLLVNQNAVPAASLPANVRCDNGTALNVTLHGYIEEA